jgi:hypothetical protein
MSKTCARQRCVLRFGCGKCADQACRVHSLRAFVRTTTPIPSLSCRFHPQSLATTLLTWLLRISDNVFVVSFQLHQVLTQRRN